jgi:hypothetical protein
MNQADGIRSRPNSCHYNALASDSRAATRRVIGRQWGSLQLDEAGLRAPASARSRRVPDALARWRTRQYFLPGWSAA